MKIYVRDLNKMFDLKFQELPKTNDISRRSVGSTVQNYFSINNQDEEIVPNIQPYNSISQIFQNESLDMISPGYKFFF